MNSVDTLHDLVIQSPVELRCPAAGDLGHELIEVLSQKPGDDAGEAVELAPLDLVDLDPEPGRAVRTRLDVDLGFDVEPKLSPALGRVADCGRLARRSGPVTGGWNSPSIWQATRESASARVDRREPEGMDRASILVGLIERARRELLDDPVEEILAELHFGSRLGPVLMKAQSSRERQGRSMASELPSAPFLPGGGQADNTSGVLREQKWPRCPDRTSRIVLLPAIDRYVQTGRPVLDEVTRFEER